MKQWKKNEKQQNIDLRGCGHVLYFLYGSIFAPDCDNRVRNFIENIQSILSGSLKLAISSNN